MDDLSEIQKLQKEILILKGRLNEYESFFSKSITHLDAGKNQYFSGGPESFVKEYLQVISNLPLPAYLINSDGYFVGCNIPFEKFVGIDLTSIIGSTPQKIFPHEIGERSIYTNKEEQEILEFTSHEIVNIKKNDEIRTVIVTESVYKDKNSKPLGILGIFSDITEKTKAEKKLRESEEKMRELNDIKDKFFHIVSHDLKSPFSALLGFSQMLIDEYDDLDEEDKLMFINQINSTANFSFKMLTNLQLWSKASLDKLQINREIVSVNEILAEVLDSLKKKIENKNLQLIINVDEHDYLLIDKSMAEVIFSNLISNAIKFSEDGESVNISTEIKENQLFVTIQDSGIGISKEDQDKLFSIDVHNVTIGKKKEKGTGLGLVLAKLFTEKNDGKIKLESNLNEGTKVTVSFPYVRKSEKLNPKT